VFEDRFIDSGFNVTRENGKTRFPGYPLTTSRISNVAGIAVSLDAKNTSTLDKKQPPFCSIKNVWARGSHQPVSATTRSEV
jgi:hypothetical protein